MACINFTLNLTRNITNDDFELDTSHHLKVRDLNLYLRAMIGSVLQYIKLVFQIIQYGRLYPTGEDYNHARFDQLSSLQEFIPVDHPLHQLKHNSNQIKHSILQYVKGQIAFIKNSFKLKGGHLTVAQSSLAYIRIPKSASTSACLALLQKVYPNLEQKSLTERPINFLADVNLRNKAYQNNAITYFTLVRNPFERIASVYHDFFEIQKKHFLYSDYLFGILYQSVSFSEFIDRISNIPDRLKDQHTKPQHYFFKYYEKQKISVQVLKLEEQEKVNKFLATYSLQLPHINESKSPYRYEHYYTPTTLQKVFNLYRTDIEIFGYQQEFEALSTYVKDQKTVQK